MLRNKRYLVLDIFDYSKHKLCNLYDSSTDVSGQAANIVKTTERNGWKELSFTIPSVCRDIDGKDIDNYRIDFLKADYRIRLIDDDGTDWFLISEPRITHNNHSKNVSVTAGHIQSILKTKNLGLEFSDNEGNNVGTAAELAAAILENTGWTVGNVAHFYEKRADGVEKVRSLRANAKTGAFKLMTQMCDLFEAKPIYHGDTQTVDIIPMNPFSEVKNGELPDIADKNKVIELHYGKNVKNVTRTLNTDNIVTKLYCYGAYGDNVSGYCGIDEATHSEYMFYHVDLTAGNEYKFQVEDTVANIQYIKYFKATDTREDATLIWSVYDPASMSYIWNDQDNHAYRLYETATENNPGMINLSERLEKQNYFSYMMDFDYYDTIGLLTDEMVQTIAEYQREVPSRLAITSDKSTTLSQSLGDLADCVGSVNFCKLKVGSYSNDDGYLKLTLDETEHENGIIYRTDYMLKKNKRFKWRVADKLKENGDPLHSGASVIWIIHEPKSANRPITFDIAYLKKINDLDEPTEDDIDNPHSLTLWLEKSKFDDSSLSSDSIYIFQVNNVNGMLGSLQIADESIVANLESQVKVVTAKHPVYFQSMNDPEIGTSGISSYGWLWKYDEIQFSDGIMRFCNKEIGDVSWRPVYFTKKELPSNCAIGDYCYVWEMSMLHRFNGEEWIPFSDTPEKQRLTATFGLVWNACRARDRLYHGYYTYYTKPIDDQVITTFGEDGVLPAGNYAIKEKDSEYTTYHAFTTTKNLQLGSRITYDSTNSWIVATDVGKSYADYTTNEIIDRTIECRDFQFDNTFSLDGNIIKSDSWEQGNIDTGSANAPGNSIIIDGGGDINDETSLLYRTGFLGVFPNVQYDLGGIETSTVYVRAHYYTIDHGYLGYSEMQMSSAGNKFVTPASARFVRFTTAANNKEKLYCYAHNGDKAIVSDEQTYYILGVGRTDLDEDNKLKGIIALTGEFVDLSDRAYIRDRGEIDQAKADIDRYEKKMISSLGDMYREGFWQKTDYVDGDEEKLYHDGFDNLVKIAKPEATYNVTYLDLYGAETNGVDNLPAETNWPDISADYGVHLVDPEINVSQWAFIDKIAKCYDESRKTTISINTNMSTIAQHSFTDVMTHIADVAQEVNGKMDVYERASNLGPDGSFSAELLKGRIDANTILITGGSSTWYSDDNGLMFVSQDGKSAMRVAGPGFAIANSKDEFGDWNWRTFGTGEGFTADEIVTGFLSAERIAAGTITTNKLSSEVGESLDISSNRSIRIGSGSSQTETMTITDILSTLDTETKNRPIGYNVRFRLSTSATEVLPEEGEEPYYQWSIQAPASRPDHFMWQQTTVSYSEDSGLEPVVTETCIQGAKGEDGVGISSIVNYYGSSSSNDTEPSTWYDDVTDVELSDGNKYLWNYEASKNKDGNVLSSTTPAVIAEYGLNGGSVVSVDEYYASYTYTDDPSTIPLTRWVNSIGQETSTLSEEYPYLYNFEEINYTTGDTYTSSTRIIGVFGSQTHVESHTVEYAISDNGETPPSDGWHELGDLPELEPGEYLWTKTYVLYSDGYETTSYSVAYQGENGQQGVNGTTIESITPQYVLTQSKIEIPLDNAGWVDDYESLGQWMVGKYLWIRNKIVTIDGYEVKETTYTEPYCDTTWEAINEVYVGDDNLLIGTTDKIVQGALKSGYYFFSPYTTEYIGIDPEWNVDSEQEAAEELIVPMTHTRWYTFRVWIRNNIKIYNNILNKFIAGIRVTPSSKSNSVLGDSKIGDMILGVAIENDVATQKGTPKDYLATEDLKTNGWQTVTIQLPEYGTFELKPFIKLVQGSFTSVPFKAPKLEMGNKATDWCMSSQELASLSALEAVESDLKKQIDNQVVNWYYDVDPTTSNPPASTWSEQDKEDHLGDTYYNTSYYGTENEKAWKWVKNDSGVYSWQEIEVTSYIRALAAAYNADAKADNMRRIFTTEPTTPYDVGDLYVKTTGTGSSAQRTILYCTTAQKTGNYDSDDWTVASTDDSVANSKLYAVQVEYRLSKKENQLDPADGTPGIDSQYVWNTTAPEWTNGEYMWQRTGRKINAGDVFDYGDQSTWTCISGAVGATGPAGRSVASVINYYQATNNSSPAPQVSSSDWKTNPRQTGFNNEKKYLWNYEKTFDADNTLISQTTPSIIGTWGDEGRGISSIVEYYKIDSASQMNAPTTNPPSQESGWQTTPSNPTKDATNLWNCELITYTQSLNGVNYQYTTPHVASTYARVIDTVQNYYCLTNSEQVPDTTDVDATNSKWKTSVDALTGYGSTNKYLWNFERTIDGSGLTIGSTTPMILCIFGEDRFGVKSIRELYAHQEDASPAPDQTSDWEEDIRNVPINEQYKFQWNKEEITYVAKVAQNVSAVYESVPHIIGVYGQQGNDGATISTIAYATTNNLNTPSDQSFSPTFPSSIEKGKYLWTKITYTKGNPSYTVSYIGNDGSPGSPGSPGAPGDPGAGIVSVTAEYAITNDKTNPPAETSSAWKTQYGEVTWGIGTYLWTRMSILYDDDRTPNPVHTTPICDTSWEAINELKVGSQNLLINTTDQDRTTISVVDSTPVTFETIEHNGNSTITIDMSDKETEWISFRIHITPDTQSGSSEYVESYHAFIKVTPKTQEATNTLSDIIVKNGVGKLVSNTYVVEVNPEEILNGWQTVCLKLADKDCYVECGFKKREPTEQGETVATRKVTYSSPKLELGNMATQWSNTPITEYGGENLINGTTDSPINVNGTTMIARVTDRDLDETDWLTFRTSVYVDSGAWQLSMKAETVSSSGDEYVYTPVKSYSIDIREPVNDEDKRNEWVQITQMIDDTYPSVSIWFETSSQNAHLTYHSPKLEYGTVPTTWNTSKYDRRVVVEKVTKAQQDIDAIQGQITNLVQRETLDTETNRVMDQASTLVTQTANNINASIQQVSSNLEGVQNKVETALEFTENALLLRYTKDQSQWQAKLTTTDLSFVNGDTVAASFGANGAYTDRLRSNKTLSVGSDSEGWFDFTILNNGMAEKWKGVSNYNLPLSIKKQPYRTENGNVLTFTIETTAGSEADISYSWEHSNNDGETWVEDSTSSGSFQSSMTFSVDESTMYKMNYIFRCVVTQYSNGSIKERVISDIFKPFFQTGPIVVSLYNAHYTDSGTSYTQLYSHVYGSYSVRKFYVLSDSGNGLNWIEYANNRDTQVIGSKYRSVFGNSNGRFNSSETYICS